MLESVYPTLREGRESAELEDVTGGGGGGGGGGGLVASERPRNRQLVNVGK